MVQAAAALRDVGGLSAPASLILTQYLLDLGAHIGKHRALILIDEFMSAADIPTTVGPRRGDH